MSAGSPQPSEIHGHGRLRSDDPSCEESRQPEARRRKPTELNKPVQLVVEGADAHGFWTGIIRRLRISDVQVHDFGGNIQLRQYLRTMRETPGWDTAVRVVCIGRDAEKDAQAAFQSVQTALRDVDLPVPGRPLALEGSSPQVAIMIWPAPTQAEGSRLWQGSGTLEDLCLACVPPKDLRCADSFIHCIEKLGGSIRHRHKARLQAYLAGTEHAGLYPRDAAAGGAWNLDAPALAPFMSLLRQAISMPLPLPDA